MTKESKTINIAIYVGFVLIISLIIFTILNSRSYIDISNLCMIRIKQNALTHEKATIKTALRKLKRTSMSDYSDVCKYVDTINLKKCVPGDGRVDPAYNKIRKEIKGCYVRGTHTIYLTPNNRTKSFTTDDRTEQIAKYSSFSKLFWEKNK